MCTVQFKKRALDGKVQLTDGALDTGYGFIVTWIKQMGHDIGRGGRGRAQLVVPAVSRLLSLDKDGKRRQREGKRDPSRGARTCTVPTYCSFGRYPNDDSLIVNLNSQW